MDFCLKKISLATLFTLVSITNIHAMKTMEQPFKIDEKLIDKAFQEVNDEMLIKQALEQTVTNYTTSKQKTPNIKQAQIHNIAQAYLLGLTTLCKCAWATQTANNFIQKLPKKVNDHVFYNACINAKKTSVDTYYSEFKKKGQFVDFNNTAVVEDFYSNYLTLGILTALEAQLPHAPYRLANEVLLFKKGIQKKPESYKNMLPTILKSCHEMALKIIPQLETPTYNFDAVKPIKLRYQNPHTKKTMEIENSLKNFTETYQFIGGEKYKPQNNSKNPYFDAERDYVVPMCVKLFTTKHPHATAMKELSALKTCIEKSKNKEFSEHMKPAVEKIEQALQQLENKK